MWESNCLFVAAVAARAGRRLRRALLDARRRLRQPRPLRATRRVTRRHRGHHPRRGVVPPGPRRHHHQPGGDEDRHHPADQYVRALRGHPGPGFRGNDKPMHYVGSMPPEAARTKARRRVAPNLFAGAGAEGARRHPPGGPAAPPGPPGRVHSRPTGTRSRGGRPSGWAAASPRRPADLFAYQEIIDRVRPDWIIETGTGDGGRALFLASICDLLDHGQVLSVDKDVVERTCPSTRASPTSPASPTSGTR